VAFLKESWTILILCSSSISEAISRASLLGEALASSSGVVSSTGMPISWNKCFRWKVYKYEVQDGENGFENIPKFFWQCESHPNPNA